MDVMNDKELRIAFSDIVRIEILNIAEEDT